MVAEAFKRRDPQSEGVLRDIEDMYADAMEGMRGRDLVATENMAFYRGLHWGVAPMGGGWVEPEAAGEEHEVLNYIRPTVRSAVASMLRNIPSVEAVPANSDHASAARAIAVQRLSRSLLANGTIPVEVLYRGGTETAVKGAVWYKVYFDPTIGPVVTTTDPATGQQTRGFQGDIAVDFVDIIDALADPHATSEKEVRHIFHRKLIPLSTLEDQFPFDFYGVETRGRFSATRTDPSRTDRDSIEQAPRFTFGSFSRFSRARGNELCELVEYWEKPTVARPAGRLVVWSGDVVITDSDLPYEWPWVLSNGQNMVPNSLYADGVVLDLKSINRSINTAATKRLEHLKHATTASLLVNRDTKINTDTIDDIAGGVIYWEGGQSMLKPEWLQPAPMPTAYSEVETMGVSVLKDVSTYSDISRGDAPAGVETGRALAYLHEFQQGVREPDVQLFKWVIVRIVRKCIAIIRDFFPENRLMQVLGENDRWVMAPLRRKDYDFDANVVLEVDSGRPSSRALRLAESLQILQVGGYNDTPEADRFRKVNGHDYADRSTIDPKEKHRMRAKQMIEQIIANPLQPLQARWQDDHEVYLDQLDDFMSGGEFDVLPPIAQQAVEAYYSEHEMYVAQQQQSFAAQQTMLSPGKSAPPPGQPGMASPFDGGADAEGQGPTSDATFQQGSESDLS